MQSFPKDYEKEPDWTVKAGFLKAELTERARPTFLILLGTAALVLLIVCANVASLTLARQLRRSREIAVRAAMGASRSRLLRQVVTESTILSLMGGLAGLLVAWGSMGLLTEFAARFTARAPEVGIDSHVLVFCFAVSLFAGIVFGSIPAVTAGENLATPLKEGAPSGRSSGSRERVRSAMVVAQVAFSLALLAGAGLMLRSFYKLVTVNPGFNPENVVSMLIQLNFTKYAHSDAGIAKVRTFHDRVLERVKGRILGSCGGGICADVSFK